MDACSMNLIQSSENINILWANLIIEELTRFGINYFCISPGSRSSPLTITTAKHPQVKTNLFYDERGAAFHALGYARASKKPAVLICTSGTAAANYYPAVIEASQEYIPLIVLSADRPPELRNSGANQTIDQVNLYGKYPRLFFDFPCPNEKDDASFVLSKIDMAVSYSTGINPGPVHLNCMFREPLAPRKEPWPLDYLNSLDNWPSTKDTFKKRATVSQNLTKNDLLKVIKIIEENRGGIILAGRNENHDDRQAILKLADKLNWPVFADITSGLRFNSSEKVIHYFDQILLSGAIKEEFYNVPIIHFGGQFVSNRLLQFLENHKAAHVHILETEKIIDPAKSVTLRIQQSINVLIEKILPQVSPKNETIILNDLVKQNSIIKRCLLDFDSRQTTLNEISVARIISQNIYPQSAIFLASSMPVRDMDMFGSPQNENTLIGSNRGASGIDGTIASAIGFSVGSKRPITLIIGDLAFIHDMNSLAMLANFNYPLTIVLINNQGGGIFSFLPIADYGDVFEANFGTPHNLTFKKMAEMFGLDYFHPESVNQLQEIYSHCQKGNNTTLIEVCTNRQENFELHKKLQNELNLF